VEVHRGNLPSTLGQRLDSVVFRIVQEGLTNAFRHGNASHVSVFCWRSSGEIRISVRDNGRGMENLATAEEGMGLSGIRERLAEVGGAVTRRNLDGGFELEVTIPYRMGEIGAAHKSADR
jgi:signal transduction histidine kinase